MFVKPDRSTSGVLCTNMVFSSEWSSFLQQPRLKFVRQDVGSEDNNSCTCGTGLLRLMKPSSRSYHSVKLWLWDLRAGWICFYLFISVPGSDCTAEPCSSAVQQIASLISLPVRPRLQPPAFVEHRLNAELCVVWIFTSLDVHHETVYAC